MRDSSDAERGVGEAAGPDGPFDPASLLGDDAEALRRFLTERSGGPLAVCGPPFGGRESVLEHAARRLGVDLLRLGPGDDAERLVAALGDGPVVVDGCQHLYERRIGGFEPLDAALRAVAECSDPVVAGWNEYAWTYLARVRGVDRAFAARATVEAAEAADLAALILDRYGALPTIEPGEARDTGVVAVRRYEVGWPGDGFAVPVPVPNVAAIRGLLADGDLEPADVVFERLAAVSEGNAGVATAIWERSRREELRPSDIAPAGADLDLDREEAFCLRIVLSKERVERAELARTVDGVERVLGRLRRDEIVSVDGDVVRLEPAAVPTAVAETERWRGS